MAIFTSNGSNQMVEVRLPGDLMNELRTEVLIGVKDHEILIPNAWVDGVNKAFPHVLLPVIVDSIQIEDIYNSFKCITFKTR